MDDYDAARANTPADILDDIFELDDSLTRWLSTRLVSFVNVDQHITHRDYNSGDPDGTWHTEVLAHAAALLEYSDRERHVEGTNEERVAYYGQIEKAAKDALHWVANNLERLWI